jgi:hypothetical protein
MATAAFLYGCVAPSDSAGLRPEDEPLVEVADPPGTSPGFAAADADVNRGAIVVPASSGDGQEPVATFVDARPAAMIDGKSVTWGDLRPALTDLAGAEALREFVLDRKLEATLVQGGVVVTSDDIAAERKLLLESLSDDPNTAIRLLDELRAKDNLGKSRFEATLRRNAGLRALVRNNVTINEDALRTMHEVVHGARRQARIMVLPDLSTAQAAINLVNSGASFADVAVEMSTDASAARGGLLEPISQADPNYPESLRQTLFSLNTGAMSGPVLMGDKYAVVLMVKRIAADGMTLQEARPTLERLVRVSQERMLMDQMARRITLDTTVTVFDEQLNEAWQRAKRAGSR